MGGQTGETTKREMNRGKMEILAAYFLQIYALSFLPTIEAGSHPFVNCGSSSAESCELCPRRFGFNQDGFGFNMNWCSGDCRWDQQLQICNKAPEAVRKCGAFRPGDH